MKKQFIVKKLSLFALCACMVAVSCKSSDTDNTRTINLPEALDNMGLVNISEVAKSIRYIPLETRDDALIGEYPRIAYDGKHIIVADMQTNIIRVFDSEGRFIRNINRVGRGPEEFSFLIDKLSLVDGNIVVMGSQYLVEYSISNTFIRKVTAPTVEGHRVGETMMIGENRYAASLVNNNSANKEYCAVVYDSLLNIHQLIAAPVNSEAQAVLSGGAEGMRIIMLTKLFQYDGTLRVFYPDAKEILSIGSATALDTAFVVEYGGYRAPGGNTGALRDSRYVSPLSFLETEGYLFMRVNTRGTITTSGSGFMNFLFNKKTGKSAVLYDKANDKGGFKDDIAHGPEFWPTSVFGKEALLSSISALSLIEFSEGHSLSKDLGKMVATIDENSNPVMVIVELK